MWKKMAAVVMSALMICPLAACGASTNDDAGTEGASQDETGTLQDEAGTSGSIVTNLEKISLKQRGSG